MCGASSAMAISQVVRSAGRLVVVVTRDSRSAQILNRELAAFGVENVAVFPDWETLPYDQFSPHPDIISDRIACLYGLRTRTSGALLIPAQTLLQRLPPRTYIHGTGLVLKPGDQLETATERSRLEQAGYRCVSQVEERGEFAVRGALLDLYPMGSDLPYRIELFDDEVETIRTFDPVSQLSVEKVSQVALLPAREYPFDNDAIEQFRSAFRNRFEVDLRRCHVYQDIKNGVASSGIEYYLPLFFDRTETLLDYLPKSPLLVVESGARDATQGHWAGLEDRYEQRRHDLTRPILSPAELLEEPSVFWERLDNHSQVRFERTDKASSTFGVTPAPAFDFHNPEQAEQFKAYREQSAGPVVITVDSAGRREVVADQLAGTIGRPRLLESLDDLRAQPSGLYLCIASLEQGFASVDPAFCLLTEGQISGNRARQARRSRAARSAESIIRDLNDLSLGAPVVHEDYGIGRYLGLNRMDSAGTEAEFLAIEYQKGDKIYVPVASLHLISRYTGSSPENAPLHRLGSDQWEKARKRAAKRARDVAAELLDLYALREARRGTALSIDDKLYQEFVAGFPFEETPDQLAAIEAVVDDLGRSKPMDRVVCGDVGFGKTEVALRAAFVAVQAGRQVALLVPTTLLAQQHYRNFLDRFANWPVQIESISRFQSKKEADQVVEGMRAGNIDIVIGTHRLLQKDIAFEKLGLLIIDEEQRFGVRQKERIKRLRAEVDLLTLTATPIPRTLNMAFSGLRDLSIIATPPAHRMAVKTFVGQWDNATLRDAVARELQRGGQVYFLHNEVQTIERMARDLEELFPQARLAVAHGQMRERELEQVMLQFHRQQFNILLCTTIIESGIDIPSANTIIINRADRFGLAQLHQLRGRVGRSHHRAYAYLIVPHEKSMTGDAVKRIKALESLDELGMGFTLATHDLEIRGAGELLGEEQSGQIQEVGFEMYMDLLSRAVAALKDGKTPSLDAPLEHGSEIDLHIPALIPDPYLPDVHARLVLYKRIASASDADALDSLQAEMIDRFGLLPDATRNLFRIAELRLRAEALGIRQMEVGGSGGKVVFQDQPKVEPLTLIKLVQKQPTVYSFEGEKKIRFKFELPEPDDRIHTADQLLTQLSAKDAA